MADFPVDGPQLKKLVKFSRKQPINFGYNPGTDDADQYLAAHRIKKPEMLGKLAKNDGAGTKAAFGTFMVAGNIMTLTCIREVPTLAKRMKRLLRMNKINLNVQVLDQSGNVIDSDVEDLPADANSDDEDDDDNDDYDIKAASDTDADAAVPIEDDADAAEAQAASAAPDAPADEDAKAAADTSDADASAADAKTAPPPELTARLKNLQPQLQAAPPAVAGKLAAAFKAAVGMIREGQFDKAGQTLGQIEGVLARLGAAAGDAPDAKEDAAAAPDPRLAKLRAAVQTITRQVDGLPEAVGAPLLADLARIEGQIDSGETEAALGGLRQVQEALKASLAGQERWNKAFGTLEAQVNAALSARSVADPSGLRVRWQYAVGLAADGAYDKAFGALPAVVAILKAATPAAAPATDAAPATEAKEAEDAAAADAEPDGRGADAGAPPKGVVAFQKSRILWVGARSKMLAEARSLAAAIAAQGSDDPDAADIRAAGEEIVTEVEMIDERLQDVLDDITNAPEGRARDALKKEASNVVAEYQSMLGTGLFAMIDQNPFSNVAVASQARAALASISRTLA